jgi:hypothetical protein
MHFINARSAPARFILWSRRVPEQVRHRAGASCQRGGPGPSATRSTCARSQTVTATGSVTSHGGTERLAWDLAVARSRRSSGSPRSTRRRRPTTATTSPTTRRRPGASGTLEACHRADRRCPRARAARGRRSRAEPHLGPPPLVRRVPPVTDDRRRDWYVWRDPAPDGGPPNNWVSHFGGSGVDASIAPPASTTCTCSCPSSPTSTGRNPRARGLRPGPRVLARPWRRRVPHRRRPRAWSKTRTAATTRSNPRSPPGDVAQQAFAAYEHRFMTSTSPGCSTSTVRGAASPTPRRGAARRGLLARRRPPAASPATSDAAMGSTRRSGSRRCTWRGTRRSRSARRMRRHRRPDKVHSHGRCRATTILARRPASAGATWDASGRWPTSRCCAACPGMAFLYQGDELGLEDVT